MTAQCQTTPLTNVLAETCPNYATGTMLFRDEGGHIVGYGKLKRTGEFAVEVTASSSPEGVSLLSPSPQVAGV